MEEPCKSQPGHFISAILYFTHPYLSLSDLNPQAFIRSPADHWSKTKESYFASTREFDFQEFKESVRPIPHNILVSFAPTETPNAWVRAESPKIPRTFRVSVKWSDPNIKKFCPPYPDIRPYAEHSQPLKTNSWTYMSPTNVSSSRVTTFYISPGNIRLTVSSIVKNHI